jgi:5-methylcytosine-specific restriction endonuclease McrA
VRVLVLNANYTYLHSISWKRAINLLLKGKVEVLQYSTKKVASFGREFVVPAIVRLVKMVRRIYRGKVPLNKRNIFLRDGYRCQYCGASCRKHPTIDHILPKSRGGQTSWKNSVTACLRCNQRKGNKTPNEAHMPLLRQPSQPTIGEFIHIQNHYSGMQDLVSSLLQGAEQG